MNYDRIKDCIVVVPSKVREYADESDIGGKARKCFNAAADSIVTADEYLSRKSIVDKMLCTLGSFAVGMILGLMTSKSAKRLGYALLTISGIGMAYFAYKKFFNE